MNTTMRCRRYAVLAHTQALVLLCSAAAPAPAPAQAAFRQEPGKSIGTVTTEGDLIVLTLNEGALGAASLFDLDHRTVRFTPGASGYRVTTLPLAWDTDFGPEMTGSDATLQNLFIRPVALKARATGPTAGAASPSTASPCCRTRGPS